MRCKFKVTQVNKFAPSGSMECNAVVTLMPVSASDGAPENEIFGKYTPTGKIEMGIQSEGALRFLEGNLGKALYIDFSPAE